MRATRKWAVKDVALLDLFLFSNHGRMLDVTTTFRRFGLAFNGVGRQ